MATSPSSLLFPRFTFKEKDCRGVPSFSVASSIRMFGSTDDCDVSMVDTGSAAARVLGVRSRAGCMLSMMTTATAAREGSGWGSTSTGGRGPLIMQRPRAEPGSSMRYQGVVLRQNGRWGAQICADHKRIWLGTFKSELAAAAAYDSAAIKLHHGDSHRNLPWNEVTIHEPRFQEQFSTEAVLEMIKSGSYESRFAEYLQLMLSSEASVVAPPWGFLGSGGGVVIFREVLFTKELTRSDVGKLYRLVIPKKHATRFFPEVSPESVDELFLDFQDPESRPWVFQYRYWKSSQSYVFTKGWNKFVKEKGLQAKDSVTFYRCEEREGRQRTYFMIEAIPCKQEEGPDNRNATVGSGLGSKREVKEGEVISGPMAVSGMTEAQEEKKRVKIFGVWFT